MKWIHLSLLTFAGLLQCTKAKPLPSTNQGSATGNIVNPGSSGEDSNGSSGSGNASGAMAPVYIAEANLELKGVTVGASNIVTGTQLPLINLKKNKADYVQILRCKASYQMRTPSGKLISEVNMGPGADDAMRSAWSQAVNDSSECHIVGTNILIENPSFIEDIAAPTGYFYYAIVPCVSSQRSKNFRAGCAYSAMVQSQPINFKAELAESIIKLGAELARAQGDENELITEVNQIIFRLRENLQQCEDKIAHDNQMSVFKRGLINLALMIGVGFLGFALGGGPMGIMMGVMMGPMLITMFMQMGGVALPAEIANQCLSPNVEGPYKDYKINELQNRMIEILGDPQRPETAETCQLAVAHNKVNEVVGRMAAMDERTMTLNKAITLMGTKGIDFNNLDSVISAISEAQQGTLPSAETGTAGE